MVLATTDKEPRSLIWTLVRAGVAALLIAVVVWVLVDRSADIRDALARGTLRPDPVWLAAAVLLLAAYFVSRVALWHAITCAAGTAIPFRDAVAAWFLSLLARIIPGKVFVLVGRAALYQRHGGSVARVATCVVLETAISLAAATMVVAVLAPWSTMPEIGGIPWWASLPVVAVVAVALHPRFVNGALGLVLRLLRRPVEVVTVSYPRLAGFALWSCANWLFIGLGFFAMSRGLLELPASSWPLLVASFAFATVVGFLSLFAPGGLGVREAVLMLVLSAVLSPALASLLALAARLWVTAGELTGAAVAAGLLRRRGA